MKNIKSFKITHVVLLLSLIITILFVKENVWETDNGNKIKTIISSDGKGYYNYLPSIFITHNLDNLKYNPSFTNKINNRVINKYYAGTAILNSPFFGIAHLIAKLTNYKADGYSSPYQIMISISALFYLFIGLFALTKLLQLFNISDLNTSLVIILILFGTNLFHYSTILPSMAHVYSFSMITLYALMIKKLILTKKIFYFYIASILLGLIVLIRPTNGIVIFFPFILANSFKEIKSIFKLLLKKWYAIIIALVLFFIVISIQLILWHKQSGSFIVWSYSNEGFYFFKPQILNVLFSFRKGLFIYTPLTFVSIFGLLVLYKKNKYQFYSLLVFLFLVIYIISSWWNWYYGDSFGLRAFIDYYSIFGILLGILLSIKNQLVKRFILYPVLFFCLILNLIQSYQYREGIIHPNNMNIEKYRHIFLKTSKDYKYSIGGNMDIEPYSKKDKKLILTTINDYEKKRENWKNGNVNNKDFCNSNQNQSYYTMYIDNEYGTGFKINKDSLLFNSNRLFVKASLKKLDLSINSSSEALFVIQIKNKNNELKYYYSFKINEMTNQKPCVWKSFNYTFELPKLENFDDEISIFIWNKDHQKFLIDDFKLEFYRIY